MATAWEFDVGMGTKIAKGTRCAKGGGIHIKPSHKGLLHKNLGVPAGKPISTSKLESAKNGASPAEKKRITFAENAKHWEHK